MPLAAICEQIRYWYLQRLDEADRVDTLIAALSQAVRMAIAVKTIAHFADDPSADGNAVPLIATSESRERLKSACLLRIHATAEKDSARNTDEVLQVIRIWVAWDEPGAQRWAMDRLNSRESVAQFLEQIQLSTDGTMGPKKYIHVASFEKIISPSALLEKVGSHMSGDLTNEERDSIKMLKAAIKRRDEGTEYSPFAIFQE